MLLKRQVPRLGFRKTELEVAVSALDGYLLRLESLDFLTLALA